MGGVVVCLIRVGWERGSGCGVSDEKGGEGNGAGDLRAVCACALICHMVMSFSVLPCPAARSQL